MVQFLLERAEQECGTLESRAIGVSQDGWRRDWALMRLFGEWRTTNRNWFSVDAIEDACIANKNLFPDGFTGSGHVVSNSDPLAHQTCAKDGATTGFTVSVAGQAEARAFVKGSAISASGERESSAVDVCRLIVVNPAGDGREMCDWGDSGAGIFCRLPENEWSWTGLLVSQLNTERLNLGLIIPQSQVLSSLKERPERRLTGVR